MDTAEIVATVAAAFAGLSTALSGWAAYTAHAARVWQRKRDEERSATRIESQVPGSGVPA